MCRPSIHCYPSSPPKNHFLTLKRRHSKWRLHSILNAAVACLRHGEYVPQTGSMAHLWAFPIRCLSDWWHSLLHLPLFTPPVLIYSSSLCDLALALPTTSPVETPCGHIHYYLVSRWAKASDGNIHTLIHTPTRIALSHLTHTGPVLEGRWASHCLHSERISHPEGSAAWWARGVSGSVSLPSEELVWVCMRPILIQTHTHIHTRANTHTQPVCMNLTGFCRCQCAVYDPCLSVRIFIKRSTQAVKESTHK